MATRRSLVTAAPALAALAVTRAARAEDKTADFLFVQTAKGMTFDKATNRLTLTGISPVTLFFTDRPERIAGNMRTGDFIPLWSTGSNSFLADPPNADISILEGKALKQAVAVLRSPTLKDDSLSYVVRTLEGELPARGADVSVFIDVFGMPMTPVSFAGMRRRAYRRAFMYR